MNHRFPLVAIAGTVAAWAVPALAKPIADSSVGRAPSGAMRENLDRVTWAGSEGTTPTGLRIRTSGSAALVEGHTGLHARPYLSGRSGAGFGGNGGDQGDGADATPYLTAGSDWVVAQSWVELIFPVRLRYLGLLWGSVDWYNQLMLFDGATAVGAITGRDVMAAPDGDQGANGTVYVNIASDMAFDRVVATSGGWAFEFDNLAFSASALPAPSTAALFGLCAAVLLAARRRGACMERTGR